MKNILGLLLIFFISLSLNGQITEQYLSDKTSFILSFRNKEIGSKIQESKLLPLDIYQNLANENNSFVPSFIRSILLKDQTTGLSVEGNSYLTFNTNDSVTSFVFIVPLTDSDLFEKEISNYRQMAFNSTFSKNGFKVYTKQYGSETISFNNEVVIFSDINIKYNFLNFKTNEYFGNNNAQHSNDIGYEIVEEAEVEVVEEAYPESGVESISIEQAEIEKPTEDKYSKSYNRYNQRDYDAENKFKDSLRQKIKESYISNLFVKQNNVSTDLIAFTKQNYDVGYFLDYTSFYNMLQEELNSINSIDKYVLISYIKFATAINSVYKGGKLTGELNFNQNEISFQNTFTSDKDLIASVNDIMNAKVNKNFLKYVKSDSLVSMFSFALNLESYNEFYNQMVDKSFEELGKESNEMLMAKDAFDILTTIFIDEEELFDWIKGDILISFNGIDTYNYVYSSGREREMTRPLFSMMSTLGNKKLTDKMMNIVRKSGYFEEKENYFVTKEIIEKEIGHVYLAYHNSIFFFTNNQDLVNHLGSGYSKSEQLSKAQQAKIKSMNSYMMFDTQALIPILPHLSRNDKQTAEVVSNRIGMLEVESAKFQGNKMISTMQLEMKGEENSLMSLLLMINEIYESIKR